MAKVYNLFFFITSMVGVRVILKEDHAKVKNLLDQVKDTPAQELREALFLEIKEELELHMIVEEEFFYPLIKEKKMFEDNVAVFERAHNEIKGLLEELSALEVDSEQFSEKLKSLREKVDIYRTEEEKVVDKVDKVFSQGRLELIGVEILSRKVALLRESYLFSEESPEGVEA